MPSFAEWEAARRGGLPAPDAAFPDTLDPNSVMHGAPLRPRHEYNGHSLETDETDPEGRFLSLTDDPSRYLGHAAKGFLESPGDAVKGLWSMLTTRPDKTLSSIAKPIANAIKHPLDTLLYANTHPDEVGSLAGQTLLGAAAPDAANAVVEKGPGIAGRTLNAVGRGAETAGNLSAKVNKRGVVPLMTAATGHPWLTAAELAAPPVLRGAGKAMQRGGAALEGLDLSLRDRTPVPPTPAELMREKVAGARGDVEAGFSRPVASKLNGLKSAATDISHPTAEVAGAGELYPYQSESLRGLREATKNKALASGIQDLANKFRDNAWANDASARTEVPVVNRPYETADYATDNAHIRARGGEPNPSLRALAKEISPIEAFYQNDPQARIGGEGRMTGQFEEGSGGLSDVMAGNVNPHIAPSVLDELSRMSGHALAPEDAQALLKKYRNFAEVQD